MLDDILDNGVRINDDFVLKNVTKDGRTKVLFGAYPGKIVAFYYISTFRTQNLNKNFENVALKNERTFYLKNLLHIKKISE